MRKLKGEKEQKRKAKEEKEFEEKKREDEILNQMPFTKFDYIIYVLFFISTLLSSNIFGIFLIMAAVLAAMIVYSRVTKKGVPMYIYRMVVFTILSLVAMPVQYLIRLIIR